MKEALPKTDNSLISVSDAVSELFIACKSQFKHLDKARSEEKAAVKYVCTTADGPRLRAIAMFLAQAAQEREADHAPTCPDVNVREPANSVGQPNESLSGDAFMKKLKRDLCNASAKKRADHITARQLADPAIAQLQTSRGACSSDVNAVRPNPDSKKRVACKDPVIRKLLVSASRHRQGDSIDSFPAAAIPLAPEVAAGRERVAGTAAVDCGAGSATCGRWHKAVGCVAVASCSGLTTADADSDSPASTGAFRFGAGDAASVDNDSAGVCCPRPATSTLECHVAVALRCGNCTPTGGSASADSFCIGADEAKSAGNGKAIAIRSPTATPANASPCSAATALLRVGATRSAALRG